MRENRLPSRPQSHLLETEETTARLLGTDEAILEFEKITVASFLSQRR